MRSGILLGLGMILVGAVFCFGEEKKIDAPKNDQGAHVLFNGKDLAGWDGNPKFWSVKDGVITGMTTKEEPTKGNTFLIWKGGTLKDFELRVMWRLENHNSGIQYRSKDRGNWVVNGYQADIADNDFLGILYEEGGRGILANVGEKVTIPAGGKPQKTGTVGEKADIKKGVNHKEWNEYVIICKGNHIEQKLNGKTTVDVMDDDAAKRAMEGILAFQLHAGPPMVVQFKEVTLKVLE
ncbi:MAG TPA: DUF1080 domain-containing protein [Tepidisphaeraceae bacterium]|nr:DUF1080 domain-containing protein [Tepidisphaeraceae bacterium]